MSKSSKKKGMKETKTPIKSSKKEKVEEKLLEEYDLFLIRKPGDESKYLCKLCEKHGSKYTTGFWHNFKDHLSSAGHKKAEEDDELGFSDVDQEDSGLSAIGKKAKNKDNKQSNTDILPKKDLTDQDRAYMDLTYSKFLLQYRLPFAMATPLNSFVNQMNEKYSSHNLNDYNLSRQTVTQAASVVTEVLKADLYQIMRTSPFSLCLVCLCPLLRTR